MQDNRHPDTELGPVTAQLTVTVTAPDRAEALMVAEGIRDLVNLAISANADKPATTTLVASDPIVTRSP